MGIGNGPSNAGVNGVLVMPAGTPQPALLMAVRVPVSVTSSNL